MLTKIQLNILVEPDDEGFYAYCPALKGLHVDGETEAVAVENAAEAATVYLNALMKRGEPLPIGCDVETICRPSIRKALMSKFMPTPTLHKTLVDCHP